MRKIPVLLLAFTFATGTALSVSQEPAPDKASLSVLAAEKARAAALVQGNIAALEQIMAEDETYVHASGKTDTRASYLAALRSGQLRYLSFVPVKLHARVLGSTAILDGEYSVRAIDLRVQPTPLELNIFILSVYARRNGRWQQIAWQSTRDVAVNATK
jgi:Domain of unknown function (DUF4440)